jgi:hypothetical protein
MMERVHAVYWALFFKGGDFVNGDAMGIEDGLKFRRHAREMIGAMSQPPASLLRR